MSKKIERYEYGVLVQEQQEQQHYRKAVRYHTPPSRYIYAGMRMDRIHSHIAVPPITSPPQERHSKRRTK